MSKYKNLMERMEGLIKRDGISTIHIRDVSKGLNDPLKLHKVYVDIKDSLDIDSSPIDQLDIAAVTIQEPNWRGGSYQWEMHRVNSSILFIEIYGCLDGHAGEYQHPADLSNKNTFAEHMTIRVIPSSEDLENKILKVADKYK